MISPQQWQISENQIPDFWIDLAIRNKDTDVQQKLKHRFFILKLPLDKKKEW
jgi:hypothetical protein